ncbi:MAG: helicase [Cressdnaviricota sp.]|nr:MAG: helicase [Cressdnaviricota sp.]
MSKARRYMFTLFAAAHEELRLLDYAALPDYVSFVVYQRELCPTTHREHFQGYLELSKPMPFASLLRDCDQFEGAHFDRCLGNQAQCIAYCRKEASQLEGPWEHGEKKGQGARSDLLAVKEAIDSGASMKRVAEDHFTEFVKYERGLRSYKRLQAPRRDWAMECYLYLGPSGTGKTRTVRDRFPNAYWKPKGPWWDQYDGEEVVVIDEMYGHSFPYTELLQLLDRYPHSVQCKGGTIEFTSKILVMTSNQDPADWYDPQRTHSGPWASSPLKRRLDEFCTIIRTGEVHRRVAQLSVGLAEFTDHNEPAPNPLLLPTMTPAEQEEHDAFMALHN